MRGEGRLSGFFLTNADRDGRISPQAFAWFEPTEDPNAPTEGGPYGGLLTVLLPLVSSALTS